MFEERDKLAKLWISIEYQSGCDRSLVSGLQAMEPSHGGKEAEVGTDFHLCSSEKSPLPKW